MQNLDCKDANAKELLESELELVNGAAAIYNAMGDYCGDDGIDDTPEKKPEPKKPNNDDRFNVTTPLPILGVRG